jgi:hypothetical protein
MGIGLKVQSHSESGRWRDGTVRSFLPNIRASTE